MNPTSTADDDRRDILGITACLLLGIASFSPWMSVRAGNSMLTPAGSLLALTGAANNFALAASSVLALGLLLAGRRWAVIIPSLYGAVAFLRVVLAWLIAVVSAGPQSQISVLRLGPAPDLIILVLGAALGIIASWRDFRAAIRLVAAREQARDPEV